VKRLLLSGLAVSLLLLGVFACTGPAGTQGPQGPAGPAGAAGPKGDVGPAGLKGDTGPAGPQGPAGPAGPAGTKGDTGPAGAQGLQGLQGVPGPQGPAGPAGAAGTGGTAPWSGTPTTTSRTIAVAAGQSTEVAVPAAYLDLISIRVPAVAAIQQAGTAGFDVYDPNGDLIYSQFIYSQGGVSGSFFATVAGNHTLSVWNDTGAALQVPVSVTKTAR